MSLSPLLISIADRRAAGRARRGALSRGSHADWTVPAGRLDPVTTLRAADDGRIVALLPLRYGRMSQNAFAFFRGSAAIMAADLASQADSGLRTQLSGDAHIANFGATASSAGEPLFDLNDFDESLPGPFEWDVKRLAASLAVAGRAQSLPDKACRALARRCVHAYRQEIAVLAAVAPLDAWRTRIALEQAVGDIGDRDIRRRERNNLTEAVQSSREGYASLVAHDGNLRLPERPPAIFRLGAHEQMAHVAFAAYVESLSEERRVLVERYRLRDVAFKAVGVGSVGTFCAIGLFATADRDVLLLQLKEAKTSVLAPFAGASAYENQGERVVVGQRLLQAEPDIFLGWACSGDRDFYVRRLKDSRLAAIGTQIVADGLPFYARLCGRTLARAHARAGDAAMIAGYLGCGDSFDTAVGTWAMAYADQTDEDFQHFKAAIASGEVETHKGGRPGETVR